jgi:hypothetical protein
LVLGAGLSVVLSSALLVGSASGATNTVTVSAAADTYVRSGAPDTNEGNSSFLRLRAIDCRTGRSGCDRCGFA